MKKILLIISLAPAFCIAQDVSILLTHPVQKTKMDSQYVFTNIMIAVEDGHGDTVMVSFSGYSTLPTWNNVLEKNDYDEVRAFSVMAQSLSLEAKYKLKNPLSFEPFKKQSFLSMDGSIVSMYKMMGKNGYGNSIETTAMVKYNPKQ